MLFGLLINCRGTQLPIRAALRARNAPYCLGDTPITRVQVQLKAEKEGMGKARAYLLKYFDRTFFVTALEFLWLFRV